MRVHELTWNEFIKYMCETNRWYPDDPDDLSEDEYSDLRAEYNYIGFYLREAKERGWQAKDHSGIISNEEV